MHSSSIQQQSGFKPGVDPQIFVKKRSLIVNLSQCSRSAKCLEETLQPHLNDATILLVKQGKAELSRNEELMRKVLEITYGENVRRRQVLPRLNPVRLHIISPMRPKTANT
ncbi:MAG: hypothetical protein WCV79_03510 [Candidatus Paceibacterota bacterium]|jgi:hypothetical protein